MIFYLCPICLEEQNITDSAFDHGNGCPKLKAIDRPTNPYDSPLNIDRSKVQSMTIDEALADLNKWWVKRMETDFGKALLCYFYPDTCPDCYAKLKCHMLRWQEHKRSIGL